MANKLRGEVPLRVNGTIYTLHFSANNIAAFEEKANRSLLAAATLLTNAETVRIGLVIDMGVAALKKNHPEITPERVGDMMDELGHIPFIQKIAEAIEATYPEAVKMDDGENPQKPAATGIGSNS